MIISDVTGTSNVPTSSWNAWRTPYSCNSLCRNVTIWVTGWPTSAWLPKMKRTGTPRISTASGAAIRHLLLRSLPTRTGWRNCSRKVTTSSARNPTSKRKCSHVWMTYSANGLNSKRPQNRRDRTCSMPTAMYFMNRAVTTSMDGSMSWSHRLWRRMSDTIWPLSTCWYRNKT